MCGRYVSPQAQDIERHWRLTPGAWYRQSFNLAPSQQAAIIRHAPDGSFLLDAGTWGFQPAWAKRAWINARAETVFTSRAFAPAARKHRCLVPAIGWYEWQGERAPKQPYVLHLEDFEPFAFAGIWTARETEEGLVHSFAILTRPALPGIARIHDRMPQVMSADAYAAWLAPDTADPAALLVPAQADFLADPVSNYVNKPAHNDARCLESIH
jgi:putative SOS response-associated peptidase YedK